MNQNYDNNYEMGYFVYSRENSLAGQGENLHLVAKDAEDEQRTRMQVLEQAVDGHPLLDSGDLESFAEAPNDNLPVKTGSVLLANADVVVIDSETGLVMSTGGDLKGAYGFSIHFGRVSSERGTPPFSPLLELCRDTLFLSHAADQITSNPNFIKLVQEEGFDRYAYQIETGTGENAGKAVEHLSLGYENDDGDYVPVVTVLNYHMRNNFYVA